MSRVDPACPPLTGRMSPVVTVAATLVRHGHEVTVHTGARFEVRVRGVGATLWPLPPSLDHDERGFGSAFPNRDAHVLGVGLAFHDLAAARHALPPRRWRDPRADRGTTGCGPSPTSSTRSTVRRTTCRNER